MRFFNANTSLPGHFSHASAVAGTFLLCLLALPVQGNTAEPIATGKAELPPDPGRAGRQTVAGIDVNNNGVRDDVERYIATHFDNDDKVMRLITNLFISTQTGLVATTEKESAKAHSMWLRAEECTIAARDSATRLYEGDGGVRSNAD
jgi:hypothetical protein